MLYKIRVCIYSSKQQNAVDSKVYSKVLQFFFNVQKQPKLILAVMFMFIWM